MTKFYVGAGFFMAGFGFVVALAASDVVAFLGVALNLWIGLYSLGKLSEEGKHVAETKKRSD